MSSSQTEPSSSEKNNSTDFFRQLSQRKEAAPPPVPEQSRVKTGLILGALLGLVYGLVTQITNSILLPDVPLALYPFGPVGNVIASIVAWAVVGGLCALPESAIYGTAAGCVTVAAVAALRAVTTLPPSVTPTIQFLMASANLFAFILFTLTSIPLMLLVRLAIEVQGELALKRWWSWRRLRAPIAAIALLGVATGIFTPYSEGVRESMIMLNTLIKRAGAAARVEDLPVAFEGKGVNDFFANAARDYTLERSFSMDLGRDIFSNPDIAYSFGTLFDPNTGTLSTSKINSLRDIVANPVIVARFANGWVLACLVNPPDDLMLCNSNPQQP